MTQYTAAVVGTGHPDTGNLAIGYAHGRTLAALESCEVVACADVVPENAEHFAEEFDVDPARAYTDHEEMLAGVEPDLVTVGSPPGTHLDIVTDCVDAGVPAVHCEKPMELTWAGCEDVAAAAEGTDTQLTVNHQRRCNAPFTTAKDLLDRGEIGDLRRVEFSVGDLFSYGTHSFDLSGFFVDDADPEWILAGLDYSVETFRWGAHHENQAVAVWQYEDGVSGFASTGDGAGAVDAHNRLVGTEGEIEIVPESDTDTLRVRRDGEGWEETAVEESPHGMENAFREVLDAMESGRESTLDARIALRGHQLTFGAWEAVRRRGRVEFPLDIADNPLHDMVESGALDPEPRAED